MKKYLFILFYFISISCAFSQITFNHRYHFDRPNALLTSIISTDSCYYASGIILPQNSTQIGNVFAKFNLDGEVMFQKLIENPIKTYQFWKGTMLKEGENFLATGYSTDTVNSVIIILSFNEVGDTLFSKEFLSPFAPSSKFISPKDFKNNNNEFVLVSLVKDSLSTINNDLSILRLDSELLEIWHKTYGGGANEKPWSVLFHWDNGNIIGGQKDNKNQTNENYESQTWVFKIDSLGGMEWEYLSPIDQLENGARAMLQTDDGGLIIASGIGTEIDMSSVNEIFWEGYIYKLDENLERVWEVDYSDADTGSFWITGFNRLIEVEDGYVAAGTNYDRELPSAIDGWMVKVSPEGEQIWSRKYHYLESDEHLTSHEIFDMERATDGGFVMVGQAIHYGQTEQAQQAWILKVDEHGCLVPGCHLIDAVENPQQNFVLQLYPNPASEQLNIYFSTKDFSSDERFRFVNLEGRVIKEFKITSNETTYMLSVESIPNGIYFLQYIKDGVSMKTEQVVIQK